MPFEGKAYRVEELIEAGVLEIGDGYRAKNVELSTHGLPFARVANINDGFLFDDADRFPRENLGRVGNKVSQPGDVVFTSKGTVGRFAYVTPKVEQFVYSPQLCFWRSLKPHTLDPRFLYFWMQGPEFMNQVAYLKGQTDMADYVSLRDQRRMTITMPPLEVQLQVASTLGVIEDRVFLLKEANATLDSIAQAIFQSWFIDFDPVTAKVEGRTPNGMDAGTAALFPSAFEKSGLGLIPEGWRIGTVEDLLVLQRGFDLPSSSRTPGPYPIFAASGPSGTHQQAMVKGPGVTTGRSGVLGQVYFVHEDYWPLNTSLWVKEFRGATPTYAYYFLQTLDLAHFDAGSAVPTLNRNHVHSRMAVVPPKALVNAYEDIASCLLKRVKANQDYAGVLAMTRDELLPRLISGRIRIPEARQAVEEAPIV